jgi:NADPH-dependent 2,4-dienoyl-CoA reductase/sulfur reductase-like enzyme/nitrite reductase/ring-hydroxylating ferredoxin subunit
VAGTDNQLTGPDFGAGIDDPRLDENGKLLGHANGEPILLARVAGDYVAVGASCTHYGGPLAEGLVADGTVRCPWHHACFSLKTGEALRAPALSPIACYEVTRSDGKVRVGKKIERDPLSPTYPLPAESSAARRPEKVVILGAGAAGSAAAEMLRRCGFTGDVTVIDGEEASPYDRPNLSKDYLAGNAPEEWIPLRPPGFYAEHQIVIRRAKATRIDVAGKRVEIENATPVSFDALLIATGAEPIRLQLPGEDQPHVHFLRSLADSRSIIAAAQHARRAVVIGGSFIGLETAASLRARNVEVRVVAPESVPLERVLGTALGTFIKSLHEEKGVVFHLGRKPQRIEKDGVVLDDGTKLEADLVVLGVGVRPRTQLAEAAGLAMDRGVSVNEYLETSAPGIFAAGDIARWPDPHSGGRIRVEHWVVAQRMGQVAARNILGARERFDFVPFFWSAHYDVSINYVGHAEQWDRTVVDGEAAKRDVSVKYEQGGKVLAVATIFRDEESLNEELKMERAVSSS